MKAHVIRFFRKYRKMLYYPLPLIPLKRHFRRKEDGIVYNYVECLLWVRWDHMD